MFEGLTSRDESNLGGVSQIFICIYTINFKVRGG